MTSHDWFIEHRTAWIARALDAEEETSYRDHLARCAECRDAVAELQREFGWLSMGVEPVAPRPGFRREALDRIVGARRRRRSWILPTALAASLLLSLGVNGYQRARIVALDASTAVTQTSVVALRDTLSVQRDAGQVMHADFAASGAPCSITIIADGHTHRWDVVVHGLPPAQPGQKYQFWFITDDGMRQGVSIDAVPGRVSTFLTGMPPGHARVMGAALSIEPRENDGTEMQGAELAKIMM
ncbi:MAG TPA: anti-sigma factor [Gemmatimonadales bacterium]|jgi:anti-sigma-K factor RskA